MPSSTEMAIKCLSSLKSCCWFSGPSPLLLFLPGFLWVFGFLSLAAVRQFSFLAQHLRFAHCCFVWMSFPFGLVCPDLKPISKAGSKAYFKMETCTTVRSFLLCFYTDSRAQRLILHIVLFRVFSLPDGNIPKVRKLSLPFFFPFAWLACGILVPQTGSRGRTHMHSAVEVWVLTTGQPEKFQHHLLIFYTYHCKIINLIPSAQLKGREQ